MVIKWTNGLYTFHLGQSLILSLLTTLNSKHVPFFLENSSIYSLIFGCARSSPPPAAISPVAAQGFSLRWLLTAGLGLRAAWAPAVSAQCLGATWRVALLGPGVEPVSPPLAGRFLAAGPPGKP